MPSNWPRGMLRGAYYTLQHQVHINPGLALFLYAA